MIEYFEIIEKLIGHLAWPVAIYFIFYKFKSDVSTFLKRINRAKIKGLEVNLEQGLNEIKTEVSEAGITIAYPQSSFSKETISNIEVAPEWAFIMSWQEIENLLLKYYEGKKVGDKYYSTRNKNYIDSINWILQDLFKKGIISDSLLSVIQNLKDMRNMVVHKTNPDVTKGEALEWLGISRSVKNRLSQRLSEVKHLS